MRYSVITEDAAALVSTALREAVVLEDGMDPSGVSGPQGPAIAQSNASDALNLAEPEPVAVTTRFFRPFEDPDSPAPGPSNGDLNGAATQETLVSSNGIGTTAEPSNGRESPQCPVEAPQVDLEVPADPESTDVSRPDSNQESPQSRTPEVVDESLAQDAPESPESEEKSPGDN